VVEEGDRLEVAVDVDFKASEIPHYRWSGRWRNAGGDVIGTFARDDKALFGDEP